MQHLTGREVVVHTSETIYRGKLIELGEKELYLQSEDGWIVIPVEKIADIKEAE
jgi:hypothetical protein